MKNILISLHFIFIFTMNAYSSTDICNFPAGQYTNEIELTINTGSTPFIEDVSMSGMKCELIEFDKDFSNKVLQYKISAIEQFYGSEVVSKAKEVYGIQLSEAIGGKYINCKDSPQSYIGVIVNSVNSFLVINGGNAYFDMTKGSCSKK